ADVAGRGDGRAGNRGKAARVRPWSGGIRSAILRIRGRSCSDRRLARRGASYAHVGDTGEKFGGEIFGAAPGGLLLAGDAADEVERPVPDCNNGRRGGERDEPTGLVLLDARVVGRSGSRGGRRALLPGEIAQLRERQTAGACEPRGLGLRVGHAGN